jgi:hypothetical protein
LSVRRLVIRAPGGPQHGPIERAADSVPAIDTRGIHEQQPHVTSPMIRIVLCDLASSKKSPPGGQS